MGGGGGANFEADASGYIIRGPSLAPSSIASQSSTSSQSVTYVSTTATASAAAFTAASGKAVGKDDGESEAGGGYKSGDDDANSKEHSAKGIVNITLARLVGGTSSGQQQTLCKNTSLVVDGTILNVTWTTKPKLSNTLYVRYGVDGYNAWTPASPTLPPGTGRAADPDPENKKKSELILEYQQTVFRANVGVAFTLLQFDKEKNVTHTYNTQPIEIVESCVPMLDEPVSTEEGGDSTDSIEPTSSNSSISGATETAQNSGGRRTVEVFIGHTGALVIGLMLSASVLMNRALV